MYFLISRLKGLTYRMWGTLGWLHRRRTFPGVPPGSRHRHSSRLLQREQRFTSIFPYILQREPPVNSSVQPWTWYGRIRLLTKQLYSGKNVKSKTEEFSRHVPEPMTSGFLLWSLSDKNPPTTELQYWKKIYVHIKTIKHQGGVCPHSCRPVGKARISKQLYLWMLSLGLSTCSNSRAKIQLRK